MGSVTGVIELGPAASQTFGGTRFTLGLDAEVLVKAGKNTIYPHEVRCPQERPKSGMWVSGNGDWHGDGYAFEVCVKPTGCLEAMMLRLSGLFSLLEERLAEKTDYTGGISFMTPTLYTVPSNVVAKAPENVKLLGCAPSFNIYDDAGVPSRLGAELRTTGCHLHVSHPQLNTENAQNAVKWADVVVGAMWMMLSPENRLEEAKRRMAYGRAGEHRLTNYPNGSRGFEYRVLPGAALSHPAYLTLMFALFRNAVRLALENKKAPPAAWSKAARVAINKGNRRIARELFNDLPFSDKARKMVAYFEKEDLKPLSLKQWQQRAGNYSGYYSWYSNQSK